MTPKRLFSGKVLQTPRFALTPRKQFANILDGRILSGNAA